MTIRDKIAATVFKEVLTNLNVDGMGPWNAADAILALPEIADLQKKLAEISVDRDKWFGIALENKHTIPRAYQMGLDAAAVAKEGLDNEPCMKCHSRRKNHHMRHPFQGRLGLLTPEAIRAIQPPADLVERVKGGE